MPSTGTIPWKNIKKMLNSCAPGHSIETGKHYHKISYNGITYPGFPKGPHGKADFGVEKGHCRKMIRFLEIDLKCAQRILPALK